MPPSSSDEQLRPDTIAATPSASISRGSSRASSAARTDTSGGVVTREQALRDDDLCDVLDQGHVFCRRCTTRIKLSGRMAFDPFHWHKHKNLCLKRNERQLKAAISKANKLNSDARKRRAEFSVDVIDQPGGSAFISQPSSKRPRRSASPETLSYSVSSASRPSVSLSVSLTPAISGALGEAPSGIDNPPQLDSSWTHASRTMKDIRPPPSPLHSPPPGPSSGPSSAPTTSTSRLQVLSGPSSGRFVAFRNAPMGTADVAQDIAAALGMGDWRDWSWRRVRPSPALAHAFGDEELSHMRDQSVYERRFVPGTYCDRRRAVRLAHPRSADGAHGRPGWGWGSVGAQTHRAFASPTAAGGPSQAQASGLGPSHQQRRASERTYDYEYDRDRPPAFHGQVPLPLPAPRRLSGPALGVATSAAGPSGASPSPRSRTQLPPPPLSRRVSLGPGSGSPQTPTLGPTLPSLSALFGQSSMPPPPSRPRGASAPGLAMSSSPAATAAGVILRERESYASTVSRSGSGSGLRVDGHRMERAERGREFEPSPAPFAPLVG